MDKTDSTANEQSSSGADAPLREAVHVEQRVSTDRQPRLSFLVVGIGASAGGLEAVSEFLTAMPPDSGMAFVVVQHLPPDRPSMMGEIFSHRTKMPVVQVEEGHAVEPNHVYVIRPGHVLTLRDGVFRLGERLHNPNNNRPIDDFFRSLADEQQERGIAIILSGMGSNGSAGAQAIKAVGGLCIAQEPETSQYPSMPRHLIDAGYADYVLRPSDMPRVLLSYAEHPYARGDSDENGNVKRDEQYLREILTVLRTRTRQDFNGYKKPTIYRRIQRRMGLNQIGKLADYARFLRQTPTEVTALADDLLIHVTGFFRDTEAWETLRERVIVPLVASRENDGSLRAWVSACSSGEEAYTLAMLLVEETERANKRLDIKVFATDMADRTLQNARNGVYPGGIETEILPERLERFFQKEDAMYRVRQEVREHVVFAPQNILIDPPFSRLDIISCRNLLIYLEPEVQQRVLGLLHFGLREGGILMLGTSETVGNDGLFESVDKKARLFRRIGPTRHGSVDFPLPHAVTSDATVERLALKDDIRGTARPTVQQMTTRALLEYHAPAAVTIDREYRILYFHGKVDAFVTIPRGEPTRDLMSLVRDSVRGAVRTAVHRATSENTAVTVLDGWLELSPGRRTRVAVVASPLDTISAPDYFVVSFQERGDLAPEENASAQVATTDIDELRRVRDELQSTIEELQTSNEELKASHEEVVSTNEELQSTNEELETSREEMQSLNEELSTVNSQLYAKMEEHQAASNDLSSLLTSTAIAVLFLDTRFRIRRFTPQVRELMELISSDIGRPVSDLAKKFTDPELSSDAEAVLTRLVPIEREIQSDSGRWFLRRITPYRTGDNRIDGVVVVFVDVTDRRTAELARRQSEGRYRALVNATSDIVFRMSADWSEMRELDGRGVIADTDEPTTSWLERYISPEDQPAVLATIQEAIRSKQIFELEFKVKRDGREPVWTFSRAIPLLNDQGDIVEWFGVSSDVTARKALEEAMQRAKNAAEEANSVKDNFLAMLSHELRTPLSATLLWVKILLGQRVNDVAQIREGLEAIHNSAEAQKELIEDLLDISRINRGQLRLQMREIDLVPVVQDAIDTIVTTANAKGITIGTKFDSEAIVATVDPDRVRQIVWNLLTNAVKFTGDGGQIAIAVESQDSTVEIRVHDNGKGIDSGFLSHVFELFRQGDSSHTRTEGGMGLGLAIVKQLVEMHGGTVTASSLGRGHGSTFTVRLPLPKRTKRRRQPTSPATQPGSKSKSLKGLAVLLVEDDKATRHGVARLLESEGMVVRQAENVSTAMESYRNSPPDVLISDIGLAGEDGYYLIRQIRDLERSRSIRAVPAIALTAFAREVDRRLSLDAGFNRHVPKPIETEILLQIITEISSAK